MKCKNGKITEKRISCNGLNYIYSDVCTPMYVKYGNVNTMKYN